MSGYKDIIDFWFTEIKPSRWWKKDLAFDALIIDRFKDVHRGARCCELSEWRVTAQGRLAEVIVLDQFSRNMFRGTARAFAYDPLALVLAQEAVASKADLELSPKQRNFLYMPYMHSESRLVHEKAIVLFKSNSEADNLDFELRHKAIIDRFGRYPHRNKVLGRISSEEELEFLQQPGSSF